MEKDKTNKKQKIKIKADIHSKSKLILKKEYVVNEKKKNSIIK